MFWKKNKYKLLNTKKVNLPGYILKYGISKGGIIYALIREEGNENWYNQKVIGLSINGDILWNSKLKIKYPNELRISEEGNCYVSFSNTIHEISDNGTTQEVFSLKLDHDQEIGSFAILSNSFIFCIQGKNKPNAKVLKTDLRGTLQWETKIPVNGISNEGVVEARADNNWKIEQKKAWSAENWLCLLGNEIIVSKNTILVNYHEMPRSGIGKTYLLDLNSGRIKWDSKPAPFESVSCIGDGKFLIGHQGYGAFDTQLVNSDGEIIAKWKSAGKTVISKDKEISLIEMDNSSSSKLYHSKLVSDGNIIRGSKIDGYYMIYPVLDHLGNIIFWRNKELMIIDTNSKKHSLMKIDFKEEPYTSRRMLLFDEGQLIFSLNKELYILKTNLGFLEGSSWACKFGNNERNPVIE